MGDPTPFTESNFLLAVIRGDVDEAKRIRDHEMTAGERRRLARQLSEARWVLLDG